MAVEARDFASHDAAGREPEARQSESHEKRRYHVTGSHRGGGESVTGLLDRNAGFQ